MLIIKNIHASVDEKEILKGIDLSVKPGELHAIMGRNGSGKSTLANIITGRDNFIVTEGSITYNGINLLDMATEDRALAGIFMSFQYPVAIPGVNNAYFLRAALNAKLKHHGKSEVNAADFMRLMREKVKLVNLDESYLSRAVNDGFSGGEKKRNEILQMLTLEPELSILDETDSGLDIDALKTIAEGVNNFRNKNRSFLAITHYQRLLQYMHPDYIHVLIDGKIVKSGDIELANQLEKKASAIMDKIEDIGGAVTAIEDSWMQREITSAAYKYQQEIEDGTRVIVGVNQFTDGPKQSPGIFKVDPSVAKIQTNKIAQLKSERNQKEVTNSLNHLREEALGEKNLFPSILESVKSYATTGEICDTLREAFGEYRPPTEI